MVAQYAWDGNAFPGNEYWLGMLTASGDPAAACCSNVPELQGGDSIDFFVPKTFPVTIMRKWPPINSYI